MVLDIADDFILPSGTSISASTSISIKVDSQIPDYDTTTGSIVSVSGSINAPTLAISGGGNIDYFDILTPAGINAGGSTTLNGGGGDDRFFIHAVPSAMTINGEAGADRYYLGGNAARSLYSSGGFYDDSPAALTGLAAVKYPLNVLGGDLSRFTAALTIASGAGGDGGTRDAIYVSAAGNAVPISSGALAAAAGSTLALSGLGNAAAINLGSGDATAVVIGLTGGDDVFRVSDAGAAMAVYVYGGLGNDTLNVTNNGAALTGIKGIVGFEGEGGVGDTLNVIGDGSAANNSGLLTAIGVSGLGMGSNSALGSIHELFGAGNAATAGAVYYATAAGAGTVENVNVTLAPATTLSTSTAPMPASTPACWAVTATTPSRSARSRLACIRPRCADSISSPAICAWMPSSAPTPSGSTIPATTRPIPASS